jgi:hypothetical protein
VADQVKRSFSDDEAKILSKWCVDIEKHYSEVHGHSTPMDIEWAKDGVTGELFVVQARPETVRSRLKEGWLTTVSIGGHGPVVLEGTAIGKKLHSCFCFCPLKLGFSLDNLSCISQAQTQRAVRPVSLMISEQSPQCSRERFSSQI